MKRLAPHLTLKNKIIPILNRGTFKNILWLSFDKILRLFLGLIVGAAVARYLGPDQWGKINYILAFVTISVTIVTMGLDGFLIKNLLETPEKKNELLGTAFFLRSCGIVGSFVIILSIFYFLKLEQEYYFLFAFLFLNVLVTPFDLIDIEYQYRLQSKKSIKAKSLAYVFGALLKITAIILKMPLLAFVAILGFEVLLASMFLVFRYQKKEGNIKHWRLEKTLIRHIILRGWPFLLSAVSVVLYMRMDQIMLGNLLSINKVGEFTAAVRITEIFLFIPLSITGSFYSSLLAAKAAGDEFFSKKMESFFQLMFILSFIIAAGITLFSSLIINILYGHHFVEAAAILRVHVWSLVAVFLGVTANQYLIIKNHQKITFYCTLIGLVTNLALNLVFIPRWGGIGAAWATIISYFCAAIMANLFFKPSRIVFFYQVKSLLVFIKPRKLISEFVK